MTALPLIIQVSEAWMGITGSSAYDVAACPARAALPGWKTSGRAADRGTALHDFARKVSMWPHTAAGMNLDLALDGITVKGREMAYALNVDTRTCRFIGENIDRKYEEHLALCGEPPLSKYEIPFSIDIEFEVGDVPGELDYKSGQSVGDVEEHGQRRVCAAGLMLYYEASSCISRVAYIWDNGEIKHDGHEFTMMDAWETCDFLKEAIDRVEAVRAQVANGEVPKVSPDRDRQCKYCPAITSCPYWTNLLRATLGEKTPSIEEIDKTKAGVVLDQVKDKLKILGELEEALKALAEKEPLPVSDEHEFRYESKAGRSYIDNDAMRGELVMALSRLGASEEEIAETL
jgi:hypothetical protein